MKLLAGTTKKVFDKNVRRLRADGKSKREAVEGAMRWHKKQGGSLVDLGELGKAKKRAISRLEQVASVTKEVDKSGVVSKITYFFSLNVAGKVNAGFATVTLWTEEDSKKADALGDLNVWREFRGLGLGGLFVDYMKRKHKRLILSASPYNDPSLSKDELIRFYQKHGFVMQDKGGSVMLFER